MGSRQRFLKLIDSLTDQDVILAFSGGVDSTVLLKAVWDSAKRTKHAVHAVTFQTTLHPMAEIGLTRKIAAEIGAIHHVVSVDELGDAGIMENPVTRCYLCKKYLFEELRKMVDSLGVERVLDGTNADDMRAHRPGIQALRELKILSPLAEAGMTKAEVRQMAREYGLSVAERPSSPCLATRFPYGMKLSRKKMLKVEKGEEYLRSLGFYNVRIRVHGDIARIEVDRNDFGMIFERQGVVTEYLKKLGYQFITLDLEGFRSGSMDYKVDRKEKKQ